MVYGNKFISNNDMSLLVLEQELSNIEVLNELSIDDIKYKIKDAIDKVITTIKKAIKWIIEKIHSIYTKLEKWFKVIKDRIKNGKIEDRTLEIEYYNKDSFKIIESTINLIKAYMNRLEDNLSSGTAKDFMIKDSTTSNLNDKLNKITVNKNNLRDILDEIFETYKPGTIEREFKLLLSYVDNIYNRQKKIYDNAINNLKNESNVNDYKNYLHNLTDFKNAIIDRLNELYSDYFDMMKHNYEVSKEIKKTFIPSDIYSTGKILKDIDFDKKLSNTKFFKDIK